MLVTCLAVPFPGTPLLTGGVFSVTLHFTLYHSMFCRVPCCSMSVRYAICTSQIALYSSSNYSFRLLRSTYPMTLLAVCGWFCFSSHVEESPRIRPRLARLQPSALRFCVCALVALGYTGTVHRCGGEYLAQFDHL